MCNITTWDGLKQVRDIILLPPPPISLWLLLENAGMLSQGTGKRGMRLEKEAAEVMESKVGFRINYFGDKVDRTANGFFKCVWCQ